MSTRNGAATKPKAVPARGKLPTRQVSTRNGAATKPKAVPARGKLPTPIDDLKKELEATKEQLAAVKEQSDTVTWLFAQLLHEMRMAAIRQALSTPQGLEAMAQKLMNGMNGQQP